MKKISKEKISEAQVHQAILTILEECPAKNYVFSACTF